MSHRRKQIPLTGPSQIPEGMTEEQARSFWDEHEVTEEFLHQAGPVPEDEAPRFGPRTKPISVRFDADTLDRLKRLGQVTNRGYQTLLKQFVAERLYEEEVRAGLRIARSASHKQSSFEGRTGGPQTRDSQTRLQDLSGLLQPYGRRAYGRTPKTPGDSGRYANVGFLLETLEDSSLRGAHAPRRARHRKISA